MIKNKYIHFYLFGKCFIEHISERRKLLNLLYLRSLMLPLVRAGIWLLTFWNSLRLEFVAKNFVNFHVQISNTRAIKNHVLLYIKHSKHCRIFLLWTSGQYFLPNRIFAPSKLQNSCWTKFTFGAFIQFLSLIINTIWYFCSITFSLFMFLFVLVTAFWTGVYILYSKYIWYLKYNWLYVDVPEPLLWCSNKISWKHFLCKSASNTWQ